MFSECGCNTEYSKKGFSCNPQTGQCECLPGVIGDTCDHCPHRWVLIQPGSELDQITGPGCFECDNCTHALLDVTDSLFAQLYPISKEFEVRKTQIKSISILIIKFFLDCSTWVLYSTASNIY